jgi:signal transduction histidine kinase
MVWEAEEEKSEPIPAVFVEVTDTGPGIDPDKIKSLFDPFFTTKMKGTGMGLPITLRIIEEHMGSIKVKSKVGKGTTFIVTLPQRMDLVSSGAQDRSNY